MPLNPLEIQKSPENESNVAEFAYQRHRATLGLNRILKPEKP
jgi:hypothetical protein